MQALNTKNTTPKVLTLNNLSITLPGNRELLSNFSLVINPGDKIGIIGEEGNGKSTLFKTIIGKPDKRIDIRGSIYSKNVTIGYLPQIFEPKWNSITVTDFFLKNNPQDDIEWERYNDLQFAIQALTQVGIDTRLITEPSFERTMGKLSGGERIRVQIAKILMSDPDILLFDEPTNDVDIDFLKWFEKFLNETRKGIAFISHDEILLERTANRVVHLEQTKHKSKPKHTVANIGFKEYIEQREKKLAQQTIDAKRERREVKEALEIVRRQKSSVRSKQESIKDSTARRLLNKKMKTAVRKEKELAEKELTEIPDVEEAIKIEFPEHAVIPASKRIVDFQLPKLKINNKVLAQGIRLSVIGPERIIIVGKNGTGKTTLLRYIKKHIEKVININVGFFPQNYEQVLKNPRMQAVSYIINPRAGIDETFARTCMGRLKFTSDEMLEPIKNLSGGQKAKLILLQLMIFGNNVLLLDEPTRNLSPLSSPILRQALCEFPGTIIAISHDRKFIKDVGEKVFELSKYGLRQVNISEIT